MAADAATAQHAEFMKQLKSQLATSFRSGVDAGSKKEQARFLDMLQRKVSASAAEASRAVRQELGHELNRVRSETKVLRAEKAKCVCSLRVAFRVLQAWHRFLSFSVFLLPFFFFLISGN